MTGITVGSPHHGVAERGAPIMDPDILYRGLEAGWDGEWTRETTNLPADLEEIADRVRAAADAIAGFRALESAALYARPVAQEAGADLYAPELRTPETISGAAERLLARIEDSALAVLEEGAARQVLPPRLAQALREDLERWRGQAEFASRAEDLANTVRDLAEHIYAIRQEQGVDDLWGDPEPDEGGDGSPQ